MPSPATTSAPSTNAKEDAASSSLSDTTRSLISLAIVLHLICVGIGMTACYSPSQLQTRLVYLLRPYLRTFNFDIAGIPYWLTLATEYDVDTSIEVLPEEGDPATFEDWVVLSDHSIPGSPRRWRMQRLGHLMLRLTDAEGSSGAVAQRIAVQAYHARAIPVSRLRVMRHNLQQPPATPGGLDNPFHRGYYAPAYQANVLIDEQGHINVVKLDDEGQIARPRAEGDE